MKALNILVVARWPLGGIRSYMKYTYKYLPRDRFRFTILASPTIEEQALWHDAREIGADLVIAAPFRGKDMLWHEVYKLLRTNRYHIIQSHGFISATHVHLPNMLFNVPHVLTIHGITEHRYIGNGFSALAKRKLLHRTVGSVDMLYAVGQEILENVCRSLDIRHGIKTTVIHNGVDVVNLGKAPVCHPGSLRKGLGISQSAFLIGFLGRFMPQKGFNYLIDAIDVLDKQYKVSINMKVLAVGSGDYVSYYKAKVRDKGLRDRFVFVPFQRDVTRIYEAVDIVVMPSIWEAYPLQPAEAMCTGTPIIVTDCIGLREATKSTPAIVIPRRDSIALADAIYDAMRSNPTMAFRDFKKEAVRRFDVRNTANQVATLFQSVLPPVAAVH